MDSGVAAVIGALIGATAGALSNIGVENYRRYRDKNSLASILAAEISSTLQMTEKRGYVELYQELLATLENGNDLRPPDILDPDPSRDNPILNAHLDKLGLFHPQLAERVGFFYQQLQGIRADVRTLGRGQLDGNPELKANIIREDITLWNETEKLGRDLIQELHQEVDRTIFGSWSKFLGKLGNRQIKKQ